MAKKENGKVTIKKLSTTELKKQAKKFDAVQEFTVSIGETEYKLTHDVLFRKTKIHNLLSDMVKFYDEGGNRLELFDLATPYITLLIIKHFTNLEVSDDIDEALIMLTLLIDLEIIGEIVEKLPQDEVEKVYKIIADSVEDLRKSLQEFQDEIEDIPLENAEILGLEQNGE